MKTKIARFDIARISRDKNKLCACHEPHYEIDANNRLVKCIECGAIVEAFEALLAISQKGERLDRQLSDLREQIADAQDKRCKTLVFMEIEKNYRFRRLLPVCPVCGKPFDPTKITRSINDRFIKITESEEAK